MWVKQNEKRLNKLKSSLLKREDVFERGQNEIKVVVGAFHNKKMK